MGLQEKLMMDYEELRAGYLQKGPEEIFEKSGELAQKLQIYRYLLLHANALEQIPAVKAAMTAEQNVLDSIYRELEEICPQWHLEDGMILWIDRRMDYFRGLYRL